MANPEQDLIKDFKTTSILVLTGGLAKVLFGGDIGTAASTLVVLGLMNYMRQVGEERRLGSNILNRVEQTVSSSSVADRLWFYNLYRNVSNGGAKMFDDIAQVFVPKAPSPEVTGPKTLGDVAKNFKDTLQSGDSSDPDTIKEAITGAAQDLDSLFSSASSRTRQRKWQ